MRPLHRYKVVGSIYDSYSNLTIEDGTVVVALQKVPDQPDWVCAASIDGGIREVRIFTSEVVPMNSESLSERYRSLSGS